MFRTTRHKAFRIPHGVAVAAGLLALASWSWNSQSMRDAGNALAAQEEVAAAAVKDSGRTLLDIGVLLLLRSGGR